MGNEETFALILQAKNETAAAFNAVSEQVALMTREIQMQTRLAEASFGEMEMQTRQLEAIMGQSMRGTAEHVRTSHTESIGWMGKFKESMVDVGKVAAGFVAGGLIAQTTMAIAQRVQTAADEVMTFGTKVIDMQRIIGGSAESASSFTAVFDRFGVSTDVAARSIAFFDKNLVNHIDTMNGGLASHNVFVKTMTDLGVATTDASGKLLDSRTVLLNTWDAISKLGTPEERVAAAANTMGNRGGVQQMLPIIMRGRAGFEEMAGGEAAAGMTMNGPQLDAIKQFKEAQRDMNTAVNAVSVQLGLVFLPAAIAAASAVAGLAIVVNQNVVPAFRAIPAAIGQATDFMDHHRLVTAALAVTISGVLAPALYASGVAATAAAGTMIAAAVATAAAWLPVVGAIMIAVGVGFLLEEAWSTDFGGIREIVAATSKWIGDHMTLIVGFVFPMLALPSLIKQAWDSDFGGIQGIVQNVVDFIGDAIGGLMDWLAGHGLFGVQSNWRDSWAQMKSDAVSGIKGVADAVVSGVGAGAAGAGSIMDKILHPHLTSTEKVPPGGGGDGGAGGSSPFGLSAGQIKSLGTGGLQGLTDLARMKEVAATAQDDLKEAEGAVANLRAEHADRQLEYDRNQLDNQQAILNYKQQSLSIDREMLVPQQRLRDLQLELKDAAQTQLTLQQQAKLLTIDAGMFEQNADLRRIALRQSQAQEQLAATRSPMEAAQLTASIENMKVEAAKIKAGMFGVDADKLEAQIDIDRTKTQTDLAKNAIDQQIAQEQALLNPMLARKQAIDDQTKAIQYQVDIAKAAFDAMTHAEQPAILSAQSHVQAIQAVIREQQLAYNEAVTQFVTSQAVSGGTSPAAVRQILKAIGLTDSAADKAATITAQLEELQNTHFSQAAAAGTGGPNSFTGGGGTAINAPVTISHQWDVTINNPQMDSVTGIDGTIIAFRAGLEEQAAAGTPVAPLGSSTDIP